MKKIAILTSLLALMACGGGGGGHANLFNTENTGLGFNINIMF